MVQSREPLSWPTECTYISHLQGNVDGRSNAVFRLVVARLILTLIVTVSEIRDVLRRLVDILIPGHIVLDYRVN